MLMLLMLLRQEKDAANQIKNGSSNIAGEQSDKHVVKLIVGH